MSVQRGMLRVVSAEEARGLLRWIDGKPMTPEDWTNQGRILAKLRELVSLSETREIVEEALGRGAWTEIRNAQRG